LSGGQERQLLSRWGETDNKGAYAVERGQEGKGQMEVQTLRNVRLWGKGVKTGRAKERKRNGEGEERRGGVVMAFSAVTDSHHAINVPWDEKRREKVVETGNGQHFRR